MSVNVNAPLEKNRLFEICEKESQSNTVDQRSESFGLFSRSQAIDYCRFRERVNAASNAEDEIASAQECSEMITQPVGRWTLRYST
jgi:hypothetical protein